jgi:hypothetical protein
MRAGPIALRREAMRHLLLALMLFGCVATAARAQDVIPDLRGTWSGKGKSLVYGSNPHHPGAPPSPDTPRVRDIEVTYQVEGQDGRLAWGHSSSKTADTKEPFAWALSLDNSSIIGADVDGYFLITMITPDRMEKCYAQNGAGPTRAVVATCYEMERVKK